ncbi:MAG: single-stranded DNA-binding protein [Bacteroidales bacterium]|nr:single-stranded DNA-binding protein [Bacteroidales bacterium]
MSLNKVMLIGNVGRDPEVRYLDGNGANGAGTKVATFTLATSERYRDRNGELRENTEWHNIVAWRQSADVAEKFVRKGTQLYIEGRLRTRSFTGQDGVKKYTTEITVDNLQLLGKRDGAPEDGEAYGAPAGQNYGGQQSGYNRGAGYGQGGYNAGASAGYSQPAAPAAAPQPEAPVADNPAESDDLPF